MILVPVPHGYGTHAEAVGRFLLIEVREGESLADQAEVIVHENAHFLFDRVPRERRAALRAAAARQGAAGERAWSLLREALPTALGQGVAGHELRPRAWSIEDPWYHIGDIDRYAKALHPLVADAVSSGRRFDEEFVRDAVRLLPADP